MAIYHLKVQTIGRGNGRSAVASAAYRHAARMENQATGTTADFTNKPDVAHSEFSIPIDAPAWVKSLAEKDAHTASAEFWSLVEIENSRVNARFANEIEFALPIELSKNENIVLARDFIEEQFCSRGLIADWAFHNVQGNPHIHVMIQTRPLVESGFGPAVSPRMNDDGSVKRLRSGAISYERFGVDKSDINDVRQVWATVQNKHLAMHGFDIRVDHRSYQSRGIALVPSEHMGVAASAIFVKGGEVERGKRNEDIKRFNRAAILARPELILDKLTAQKSVFDDRDIAREVFRFTQDRSEFDAVKLRIGASDQLIALSAPIYDPVSGQQLADAKYTTLAVFENEYAILESIDKLIGSDTFYVPERKVNRAIRNYENKKGFFLTDQQKAVIRYTTSGRGISVVVGYAGAGKSTVMDVVREAYEARHARVFGAALAGVAVDGLQKSSGIASYTIAAWEHCWRAGKHLLQEGDVFVLDEAGMVSSEQMRTISDQVARAGAKLILLGDYRQLQPIMSGAAFRGIADHSGYRELTGVVRQTVDWQCDASVSLASGRTAEALLAYKERGCIELHPNKNDAVSCLIRAWNDEWQVGADILILAHLNTDVELLNSAARASIQSNGGLVDEFAINTSRGTKTFAIGDRIIFLEGDAETGLRNGTVATIISRDTISGNLTIDADAKGHIEFSPRRLRSFSHGYAQTIHKAQGKTVDKVFILASDTMDAQLTYVALTRHRQDVRLFAAVASAHAPMEHPSEKGLFQDETAFTQILARDRQKDVSFLYRGTQDYADAVRDFVQRRDMQTMQDWKGILSAKLSMLRTRLGLASDRLKRFGGTLFPRHLLSVSDTAVTVTPVVCDTRSKAAVIRDLPRPSSDLFAAINRLIHVQDHERVVKTHRAREDVYLSSRAAFSQTGSSEKLNKFANELRNVLPVTAIIAAGIECDTERLGEAYKQLSPDDQAHLQDNWRVYHAVATAAFAVTETDVARSLTSDMRESKVNDDYEREREKWRVPDEPLIPAVTCFRETIDGSVSRQMEASGLLSQARQSMQDSVARIYRRPDLVVAAIAEHVKAYGEITTMSQALKARPEQAGAVLGGNTLFGRPDDDRRRALDSLEPMFSAMDHYASTYVTLKTDLTMIEASFRDKMRTPVAGLSSGTRQMMEAFLSSRLTLQQWSKMHSFAESRREILELSNMLRDRLGDYHLSPTETEHFASLARFFEPETLRSITQIAADCVVAGRRITHEIQPVSIEVEMLRPRGDSHTHEIV